ncbi:MAG: HEAT repeat domain-containing protein [Spirochaetota bacterium]
MQPLLNELNSSLTALNEGNETNKINGKEEKKTGSETIRENKEIITPEKPKEKTAEKQKPVKIETNPAERRKADWIIKTIDSGIHKDRKSAINQILTIKDQSLKNELGKKLIEVIKDEAELEVKIKAITVIGEIKVNEAVPDLLNCLNDDSEDVKVAAIYAIKRIGDISAKPTLITKLKEQKFENSSTLIEALIDTLGEFKAIELSAFAAETIKNTKTNQIVRELLVLFLGKVDSKESKGILLELLNDEDENEQIRAFAVNSIANLKINEAIPDIEKVTKTIDSYPFNKKKKYFNLYIYCIAALVKLGDEKAFPLFLNALRSDNAVVRLKAVKLVKETKDKRTIDILKYKMLYDPSLKVQSAAKEALKELGVDIESVKIEKLSEENVKKLNIKKEESADKKDSADVSTDPAQE